MGIKISQLTSVATPALSDVFPIVQSGVTYKESFTQLTSLFATAGVNNNITSMTGLTGYLQAPAGVKDSSGNIVVTFVATPTAVNFIEFSNDASGSGPFISAVGSDAAIALNLSAKGVGQINLNSDNNNPLMINSGTGSQHHTTFTFVDSAQTRTVTFPDADGTIVLANKVNGTEAANAVTASGTTGVITTSALTVAGGANYAITWTNTFITTSSTILLTVMGGTNTVQNVSFTVTAGAATSTLSIFNNTAATALNGTIKIGYLVIP